MAEITPDACVAAAREETGLEDLGSLAWRDGLEALMRAAADEADLNEVGLGVLKSWIHRRLVNRLQVIDWVERHPKVREERIERPLFVLGMLRTGTTILCELLGKDPVNRPLMKWEGLSSTPPPEPASLASDPRVARTIKEVEFQYGMVPALRPVHYEPGDGPTECVALLTQAFRAQDFFGLFRVPSFLEWYRACDFAPGYAYHRLSLQLLQSGGVGGRWSLKAPGHMHALDALVETYPDARLIVTHRDPLRTVPSAATISREARPDSLCRTTDREALAKYFGRLWVDEHALMVERMMEFRDRRPDVPVYDMQFRDLARDPLGEVARAYACFGDELSAEAEAAMRAHLAENPRGKFGKNVYGLGEFGLEAGEIRERYASYCRRFDVPEEG